MSYVFYPNGTFEQIVAPSVRSTSHSFEEDGEWTPLVTPADLPAPGWIAGPAGPKLEVAAARQASTTDVRLYITYNVVNSGAPVDDRFDEIVLRIHTAAHGTVDKTFDFAINAMGLLDFNTDPDVDFTYEAGDGDPAGSVKFVSSVAGTHSALAGRNVTGETWETWGVAPGATVTDIEIVSWKYKEQTTTGKTSATVMFDIMGPDSARATTLNQALLSSPIPAVAMSTVGKALDTRWVIKAAVADTLNPRWAIRTPVSDAVNPRWGIRTSVGDTVAFQWNLLTLAGAIGKALEVRWAVRQLVTDNIQSQWAARILAADAINPRWSVRSGMGNTVNHRWSIMGLVGGTVETRWVLRASVADPLVLVWDVIRPLHRLQPTGDLLTTGWTDHLGGTSDLWSVVDEGPNADDSDYARSVIA